MHSETLITIALYPSIVVKLLLLTVAVIEWQVENSGGIVTEGDADARLVFNLLHGRLARPVLINLLALSLNATGKD